MQFIEIGNRIINLAHVALVEIDSGPSIVVHINLPVAGLAPNVVFGQDQSLPIGTNCHLEHFTGAEAERFLGAIRAAKPM